jgi:hypothetical protein
MGLLREAGELLLCTQMVQVKILQPVSGALLQTCTV